MKRVRFFFQYSVILFLSLLLTGCAGSLINPDTKLTDIPTQQASLQPTGLTAVPNISGVPEGTATSIPGTSATDMPLGSPAPSGNAAGTQIPSVGSPMPTAALTVSPMPPVTPIGTLTPSAGILTGNPTPTAVSAVSLTPTATPADTPVPTGIPTVSLTPPAVLTDTPAPTGIPITSPTSTSKLTAAATPTPEPTPTYNPLPLIGNGWQRMQDITMQYYIVFPECFDCSETIRKKRQFAFRYTSSEREGLAFSVIYEFDSNYEAAGEKILKDGGRLEEISEWEKACRYQLTGPDSITDGFLSEEYYTAELLGSDFVDGDGSFGLLRVELVYPEDCTAEEREELEFYVVLVP